MEVFDQLMRGVAAVASPGGNGASLTVLLYHRVLRQPDPLMPQVPDVATFNHQISALAHVFRIMALDEALMRLREGTLPPRALCITFDDGYLDNIQVAVPVLRNNGVSATFFVATGFLDGGRMMHDTVVEAVRRLPSQECDLTWIGLGMRSISDIDSRVRLVDEFVGKIKYLPQLEREAASERLAHKVGHQLPDDLMMSSDDLRRMVDSGMSVGCHTHDHPILSMVDSDEAWTQIVKSRDAVAAATGVAPTLFAYPNGKPNIDYRAEHVAMVKKAGFSGAASVSFGTASRDSDHFQVPRFVPWDSDPRHLVFRILAHPWRHRGTAVADA